MELLIGAAVLAMVFGPLSLIAWMFKKAIARRKRQRQINQMFKNLPVTQKQPTERPTAPRVLYVPKHEEEEERAPILMPSIFIGWDLSKPTEPEAEVFKGKGGASGGAGASGTWEPTAPVIEETIREEATTGSFDTTTETPDVSAGVQEP
jgi:hypothetical protein